MQYMYIVYKYMYAYVYRVFHVPTRITLTHSVFKCRLAALNPRSSPNQSQVPRDIFSMNNSR